MVRKYKRVTNHQSWNKEKMGKAIQEIINGSMSYRVASERYNIPQATLFRKVKFYNSNPDMELVLLKGLGKFKKTFSEEAELQIIKYLKEMEAKFHGLTLQEFRILAFQIAGKNNLKHRFTNGIAGQSWMESFLERHQDQLTLRKPEATSIARSAGFNNVVVANFFSLLESLIHNLKLTPDRIWNVDETGCSTVSKCQPKIIAQRGKKQVGVITSAERGQLVTVEVCVSAAGVALPPLFIFPRKKMKQEFLKGSIPGSWGLCHPSGWMQSDLFFDWLKWFIYNVQPTEDKPVLLLLDRHTTHTQNLAVLEYARENWLEILCFPPHCTHRLQPVDVSLMRPISIFYSNEVKRWHRSHPGQSLIISDIPKLFSVAFKEAAKTSTIKNGFKATGIWSFNNNIFTQEDFMPAEVTNRPETSLTKKNSPEKNDETDGDKTDNVNDEDTTDSENDTDKTDNENGYDEKNACKNVNDETHGGSDTENDNDEINSKNDTDKTVSENDHDEKTDCDDDNDETHGGSDTENDNDEINSEDDTDKTDSENDHDEKTDCDDDNDETHGGSDTENDNDEINSEDDTDKTDSEKANDKIDGDDDDHKSHNVRDTYSIVDTDNGNLSVDVECADGTNELIIAQLSQTLKRSLSFLEVKTPEKKKRRINKKLKILPQDILPIPAVDSSEPRKTRRRGKTAVLTSAEYREELKLKQTAQRPKHEKRKLKHLKCFPSSEDDDKTVCIFCGQLYSESSEDWIQCSICNTWIDCECAGVDKDDISYICDFCQ